MTRAKKLKEMTPEVKAQYDLLRPMNAAEFQRAMAYEDGLIALLCDAQLLRLSELQVTIGRTGAVFGRKLAFEEWVEIGCMIAAMENRSKELIASAKAQHAAFKARRVRYGQA